MFFSIRHVTRFQYSAPVSESNMEVRMRPRSDGNQRCLKFDLQITPRSKPSSYKDHNANTVMSRDKWRLSRGLSAVQATCLDGVQIRRVHGSCPEAD